MTMVNLKTLPEDVQKEKVTLYDPFSFMVGHTNNQRIIFGMIMISNN